MTKKKKPKIYAISDTHSEYRSLSIPKCDILIHSGDIECYNSLVELTRFIEWAKSLKQVKYFICCAGNHDFFIEQNKALAKEMFEKAGINYLENEGVEIEGLKIWGSPYTVRFMDWAFMLSDEKLGELIWSQIPEDLDILITHGPAYDILDETPRHVKCGSKTLLKAIKDKQPKVHIFGHIHCGFGSKDLIHDIQFNKKTKCYNVASMNEGYDIVNKPVEIVI